MSRRVRRRGLQPKEEAERAAAFPTLLRGVSEEEGGGTAGVSGVRGVDWTSLPDDTVLQLFSRLNYRDRASASSACRAWRQIGSLPCLWTSLDLRSHRCDPATVLAISARCNGLRWVRFRGADSAAALIHLQARELLGIYGDGCREISDATLSVLAARHELLEDLQIGPDAWRISSDAVRHVALCCSGLRRLRLSGIREIDGEAIGALARHCPRLEEIAFLDCGSVDELALGDIVSLRFLSLAGTWDLDWDAASQAWSKLPSLICLDLSRTEVSKSAILRLLSSSKSLRILCALSCSGLEEEQRKNPSLFSNSKNKLLLAFFTEIFKDIASLFSDNTAWPKWGVFEKWRSSKCKNKDLNDTMEWLEWMLSYSLLKIAERNPQPLGIDEFWLRQGAAMLLSLSKSLQEDIQERAATGLATFVVINDENATVDPVRAEMVMRDGGIPVLLDLAKSYREGVQSEAAKAIANLSVNPKVAKAVADEGGITILAELARSLNRSVAEEAAGGLWNLSVGEEHKVAIVEAGGVKALVDLIYKWNSSTDGVLERAAGALANLAADDKCSMEVAVAGGVHALVMLARSCKAEGVQEQAARALANLAAHGDSNSNNAAVGQEAGALEALVQLTCSQNEGVRQEAAGALWNLSFDDRNREAIAAAGGVVALVALAQSCSDASPGLQERAAGALWGLSVSEANSVAIGREGGVAPLIALACSEAEDVHETAAGALWNLAFNPGNALRIVEEGGVAALVYLCSSSKSKMARFMATLALAYMFDGRMDEIAEVGSSSEGTSKNINFECLRKLALKRIETFVLTFPDLYLFSVVSTTSSSSSASRVLMQIGEAARIQEAGHLRCSGAEIGRFVAMLRNYYPVLRSCAAFALLQFIIPGGRHSTHHANLLQKADAAKVLRKASAATNGPAEAKIFSKVVSIYLKQHTGDPL